MGFLGKSSEYSMQAYTMLENIFVSEYLPYAPETCVKVYLYGLFLTNADADGDVGKMATLLNLEVADVMNAYAYWQEMGLVQILKKSPFEVRYLPVRAAATIKKYKPGKYNDFNNAMQDILSGRMIGSNEYHEYYALLDNYRMEPEALIMIAKYCALLKGDAINYPYILAVAKNWALEGVTTVKRVEEKLNEYEVLSADIAQVLKALGVKRAAEFEERQLFQKFTGALGFTLPAILYAAKKSKKGGFRRLDSALSEYYAHRVTDVKEMEAYDKNKDKLYALARSVNKLIGVYYEQLDHIVETYTIPWLNLGFTEDALTMIADYCFKSNIRTLDGMNNTVLKLHKQGLLTAEAIAQYLGQMLSVDDVIRNILSEAGLTRNVNSWDRDNYRTWTYAWKLSDELILAAAALARGKAQPVPYMNRILSDWHDKGVKSPDEVKNYAPSDNKTQPARSFDRTYTKAEWDAMIDNLDDIEF